MKSILAVATLAAASSLMAQQAAANDPLAQPRLAGERQYRFTTDYVAFAPEGTRIFAESASIDVSVTRAEDGTQELTCTGFRLKGRDGSEHSVPALAGWKHTLDLSAIEVMGIPHAKFAGLVNEAGTPLGPELEYRVYNTFVDFYTFNNVFGEAAPESTGTSIDDLHSIGQTLQHYSAFSRPPLNVGNAVKEGSYFQNGKITIEWKGMSSVAQQPCALVGFDSGECNYVMLMEPAPGMKVDIQGGSRYWGDLYVDVETRWLKRATFRELVLVKVLFGDNPPINGVVVRDGTIEEL